MADARKARPVSGEIMTAMAGRANSTPALSVGIDDIVDADYEVLPMPGAAAPPAPTVLRGPAMPPAGGMNMLRKPDIDARPSQASRGGPLFWVAGIAAVLAAFWISGGDAAVRNLPVFADGRPDTAFTLSGVTSHVDVTGQKPLLFVDGEAGNDGAGPSLLPPLEIKVTGNDGRITRYTLGTAGYPLRPGERFAFSSRFEVPKNGVKTVSVAFAE